MAQKQSDAHSPSERNQVSANSKEDTETIDLTMDDKEKADGDAHTASDSKHTTLSSHAASSQRGMVMKIEVGDAADGTKRRRIMHSNALGAIMQIHVEDAADGSKRSELHTLTRARDLHLCQTTCSLQMLVVEQRRRQSRLPTMPQGVQQRDAKSTCTHHQRQV